MKEKNLSIRQPAQGITTGTALRPSNRIRTGGTAHSAVAISINTAGVRGITEAVRLFTGEKNHPPKLLAICRPHTVHPEERRRIPNGNFEYVVTPFGLTNAPPTFQMSMNQIFSSLVDKCIIVYLDDILIHSKTREQH
ncbi:hypothetical protein CLOM_g5299 [Closterium sp. NIES-68]|nr:hypothetical protein CLOM_g5299 [Closterium sp. NIES-68]